MKFRKWSKLNLNKYVIISDKTNVPADGKTKSPMLPHRGFLRSNYKIIKETTRYAFNLKFSKIPNKTYLHSMK